MLFLMKPYRCPATGKVVYVRTGKPLLSETQARRKLASIPNAYAVNMAGNVVLFPSVANWS